MGLSREASEYWKEGKLRDIPGVGEAIAEKIDELLRTGKLQFLEKLKKEVPESLADWLKVPSLGPKKISMIWKALKITTLPQLEKAAKAGKLRDLPGMGSKSEEAILAGLQSLARRSDRIPLGIAWPLAQNIAAELKKVKGVVAAEPAGSLRRMRSTVGDLDILVAAKESAPVMEAFVKLPRIARVLSKGEFKTSIEFNDGVRAQVWVHPPERFGTALQYATGSKDHSVQVRQMALDKGLSLSQQAFAKVKGGGEILCDTEEKVYQTLGLQYIPPELREDRGEIQAAKAGKLPKLIQVKDIKADLQVHSTYSDGKLSMLEMARIAARHGIQVIAFTDHSVSLGVTGGLSMADHKKQAAEIKKIQKQLGDSIRVLHATEVEIKADGSLDYPDDFLAEPGSGAGLAAHLTASAAREDHAAPVERRSQSACGYHRAPYRPADSRSRGRRRGHGGAPQGRRRDGRGPGDQRPLVTPRPGGRARTPRQGAGHSDQHQHRLAFRGRLRRVVLWRGHRPPRLARAEGRHQLLAAAEAAQVAERPGLM